MITPQIYKSHLGTLNQCRIATEMPDNEYHQDMPGFSSSVLKSYYTDPKTTFADRVRGQADIKDFGRQTLDNFRLGRAIHCYVLEGEVPFKQRFPVFGGDKKSGKLWADFKLANAEALERDDILNKAQFNTVVHLGQKGKEQFDNWVEERSTNHALNLYTFIPEISFFASYSSGIEVKVRCDGLIIWQSSSGYHYEILDLKTIEASPTTPGKIQSTIQYSNYDLQAALYKHTVEDCLNSTVGRDQLVRYCPEVPNNTYLSGEFTFFWLCKATGLSVFQPVLTFVEAETDALTWGNTGRTKVISAFSNYKRETEEFQRQTQAPGFDVKKLLPVELQKTAPTKRQEWEMKDLLNSGTIMENLAPFYAEEQIQEHFSKAFGKPLKPPRPKKEVKKKAPPPVQKSKWSFAPPPSVPAQETVSTNLAPPPTQHHHPIDTLGDVDFPTQVNSFKKKKGLVDWLLAIGWLQTEIDTHMAPRLPAFKKNIIKFQQEMQK